MVLDISRKYAEFTFPELVSLTEVSRIEHLYSIPQCIIDAMPKCNDDKHTYDSTLDVRSRNFDPLIVLHTKRVIAPRMHLNMLDNLSKARQLLPGEEFPVRNADTSDATTSARSIAKPKETRSSSLSSNIITRIALTSSRERVKDEAGELYSRDSPLAMIHAMMKEKSRIRVIIRRINSVRGTVDGYVRAFDKHFNLLLTDVDETYSPRKSSDGNQDDLLMRHLPQLLVRGDNVVLICRVPSGHRRKRQDRSTGASSLSATESKKES